MKRAPQSAIDLFSPAVDLKKQHLGFRYVAASSGQCSARRTVNETYARTTQWDKHFVQQFQLNFDARVWELYLYRYFSDAGLNVRVNTGTDFALYHRGAEIFVEAVTANPEGGGVLAPTPDVRDIRMPTEIADVRKRLGEEVPICNDPRGLAA